jgi:hypothetical protein
VYQYCHQRQFPGMYHPVNNFVPCNRTSHGVVDPAWFSDTDGGQYIVYKAKNLAGNLEIRGWRTQVRTRATGVG